MGSDAPLPSPEELSDRITRLIARRDFEAVAALGVSVRAVARARQLSQLAAVSEDLVNAARIEDAEQSAWWGRQLVARLGDAPPPLDEREATHDVRACDALAHLATLALGVPVTVMTVMVEDRVKIVGAAGVPPGLDISQGLPRGKSFTHVIIDTRLPLLAEDARADHRLDGALFVSTHGVAAIAGVPLTNSQARPSAPSARWTPGRTAGFPPTSPCSRISPTSRRGCSIRMARLPPRRQASRAAASSSSTMTSSI